MSAPRSRGKPRKRSQVKPPERPLSNDMVTIYATFKAEGPFQITFATYRKVDNILVATRRFPTLALAVLRTQLLAVHNRLWLTAKLPVNPTMVNDHLIEPGTNAATHRREYVKLLCEWFNAACQRQNVQAVMIIGRPPQPRAAKKTVAPPQKTVPAKKVVAKKTASKKVAAKKAAPAKANKAPSKRPTR